jgi:hypothetical protein
VFVVVGVDVDVNNSHQRCVFAFKPIAATFLRRFFSVFSFSFFFFFFLVPDVACLMLGFLGG